MALGGCVPRSALRHLAASDGGGAGLAGERLLLEDPLTGACRAAGGVALRPCAGPALLFAPACMLISLAPSRTRMHNNSAGRDVAAGSYRVLSVQAAFSRAARRLEALAQQGRSGGAGGSRKGGPDRPVNYLEALFDVRRALDRSAPRAWGGRGAAGGGGGANRVAEYSVVARGGRVLVRWGRAVLARAACWLGALLLVVAAVLPRLPALCLFCRRTQPHARARKRSLLLQRPLQAACAIALRLVIVAE